MNLDFSMSHMSHPIPLQDFPFFFSIASWVLQLQYNALMVFINTER